MVVEGHHQVIDVDMEEEVVMVEQAGVVLASHAILNFEVGPLGKSFLFDIEKDRGLKHHIFSLQTEHPFSFALII